MALVINTNMSALNAQKALNKTQDTLGTTIQRLSTGLRINSAKMTRRVCQLLMA